jgi:hypothetical protein
MQKHKFGVTCLGVLFAQTATGNPSMKNSALRIHAPDVPKYTT